jgi:type IV pilus assembly protein PilW
MSLSHHRQATHHGFGLIELLVALVIGAFLITGAITIYAQSRSTFRASEEVSRLQETARYAMSFLESDIRMANYWGLNNRPEYIINRAGQPDAPTGSWVNALCGDSWPIDLDNYVQAFDDNKGLACIPSVLASSDVVVVRRTAEQPVGGSLTANALYLQTSRLQGTLFLSDPDCLNPQSAACIPSGYLPPQSQSSQVLVHGYYVTNNAANVPTMRRVRLVAGPAVLNEEIIPGVEDMQVELGVDNNADTTADYFAAANLVPASASIVAVRIWVRVRSAEADFQFTDGRTYTYSNVTYTPGSAGNANRFRRMLMTKTIQLRNTRR